MLTNQASATPKVNPFETRWIRPDSVDFLCSGETQLPELLECMLNATQPCELIGDHGIGKTTLAYSLLQQARNNEIESQLIRCGKDGGSVDWREQFRRNRLLILDEFEQLSTWQRRKIKQLARKTNTATLIIAHETQGLPALLSTRTTQSLLSNLTALKSLVRQLQIQSQQPQLILDQDVENLFNKLRGNSRDVLFTCYDLFEQRRIKKPVANG